MFVGCVVAGSVMLCCQGAKVRGALIRDVAAYAIAVVAVAVILWSGKVITICLSQRLHLLSTHTHMLQAWLLSDVKLLMR